MGVLYKSLPEILLIIYLMEELFKELSVGYLTGNISETEIKQFLRIYKSSSKYVKIFDDIESSYSSGLIYKFEADKAENYRLLKDRIRLSVKRRRIFRTVAIAASVLILCVFSAHIISSTRNTVMQDDDTVSIVAEVKQKVILPDGSLLWLKPGSRLTYSESEFENQRIVNLVGEAYFDIRHNQYNPFVVKTGIINVKVLGTIFNLKTDDYNKAVETTLARGSVVIQNTSGQNLMFVKPDQQVYFEAGKDVKVTEVNSWDFILDKYGSVTIPDADLSEILGVIEREYKVDVSIISGYEECPAVTFGFSRGDKMEDVLNRLQLISGTKICINN